ncbi:ABC transporter permease [Candidatus Woesearchaeota archaeon]|nr:ABC transporter permease [Candidatus Woesearchaeota archaeon]
MKDYFLLAFNNLKHRGLRSWLTILGIFIGIAAVVALISLGQGLKEAITGQFSTLSADRLVITSAETGFGPPGSTAVKKLTERDLDVIKEVQGIEKIISRLLRVVKAEYNNELNFIFTASIPNNKEGAEAVYEAFNLKVEKGKKLEAGVKGKVILGSDIASSNTFDKKIEVGKQIKIQDKDFEVIGILKKSGSFQVNQVILMNEEDMKDILNIKDEIDIIAVQVSDKDRIEDMAEEIKRKLRQDRNQKEGEEDFSVQTPVQALSAINTILNIINLIVTGIAAISLLIGGIGIANTMFTSVLERRKEIGIMKAVGAKNKDVLKIFVIESGLLGLVGGIGGALIGLSLAYLTSFSANSALNTDLFKVSPSVPLLVASILFAIIIGIIAGLIPSYQASKLKPVDALRQ